jgi:hypothetical protein
VFRRGNGQEIRQKGESKEFNKTNQENQMNEQTTTDEYVPGTKSTRAELDAFEAECRESTIRYMRKKEAECLQNRKDGAFRG